MIPLVLLLLVAAGTSSHSESLLYLPMFGMGVVMAFGRERLRTLGLALRAPLWWALLFLALMLLNSYWNAYGIGSFGRGPVYPVAVSDALITVGACLIVFLLSSWVSTQRALDQPGIRWLGRRSFSLYLVHEPIVVAVAFALQGRGGAVATMGIAIPTCLVAADVFFRAIELPAQNAAIRVGRWVEMRTPRGWMTGRLPIA
jgi:peptidoglycan/LPS O-acetylase OafA/YrhL